MMTRTAIVVEDQPIIWEYAESCLEPYYGVQAFCCNTEEAELAFRKYKPDLVWLDCYLGELSEYNQGLKNSGLQLAMWIKRHNPKTKIFLFTASNELGILNFAKELGLEGIALGGKFIKDKYLIKEGIKSIASGDRWMSPNVIEDIELDQIGKVTVFEFCVIFSLLVGKSTSQIADEFDTTRKRVNNSIYRVKEKFDINEDISREDFLEIFKDKVVSSCGVNQYYNLSELVTINSMVQDCLAPIIEKIKAGGLAKLKIGVKHQFPLKAS